MNWIDIEEKYPKAWMRFKDYFKLNGARIRTDEFLRCFNNRELYDFFDNCMLYVIVSYQFYDYPVFSGSVSGVFPLIRLGEYENRTGVEVAGFVKAFEVLESLC